MVMLALAVTQLFTFEELPGIFAAMRLPGLPVIAWVLAIGIPLLEIASLPYLLSMRVSKRARRISMVSGAAAGVVWLYVTAWTSMTMGMSVESGIFGGTLATNSGWWSVLFAVLLLWSYWLTVRELPKRREKAVVAIG